MAKLKMEFDKDYIYNLIMPSVPPANASEAPAAAADMPGLLTRGRNRPVC